MGKDLSVMHTRGCGGTRDVLDQENGISCRLITKLRLWSDCTWNIHEGIYTNESHASGFAERNRDVKTAHLLDLQQTWKVNLQ